MRSDPNDALPRNSTMQELPSTYSHKELPSSGRNKLDPDRSGALAYYEMRVVSAEFEEEHGRTIAREQARRDALLGEVERT
jgi:hypothetical protein